MTAFHARRRALFTVLVAVIVADQAAKWWAWRHTPGAQINTGGDPLVGHTVGRWYAAPLPGALLDLLGAGLLGTAARVLLYRCQAVRLLVPAAFTISGWSSNLLDRLGLHRLTAPGSVRGAVDFIPVGNVMYNVADFVIIAGTLALVLGVAARLGIFLGSTVRNRVRRSSLG